MEEMVDLRELGGNSQIKDLINKLIKNWLIKKILLEKKSLGYAPKEQASAGFKVGNMMKCVH